MPVDRVGEGLGDSPGQAEPLQLLRSPVVNQQPLVGGIVIEVEGGRGRRFHHSLLRELVSRAGERSPARSVPSSRPASIYAARVAELFGLRLAVMRTRPVLAKLIACRSAA